MSGSNVGCGGKIVGCVVRGSGSFGIFLNGGSGGEDSLMEKGANSRDYTKQRED